MRQAQQDWTEHRYVQAVTGFVARHWPLIAWAVSFVLLALTVLNVQDNTNNIGQLASQNRATICALVQDYDRRIEQAQSFLDNHEVLQNLGLDPATLENQIAQQTQTRNVLSSGLDCE